MKKAITITLGVGLIAGAAFATRYLISQESSPAQAVSLVDTSSEKSKTSKAEMAGVQSNQQRRSLVQDIGEYQGQYKLLVANNDVCQRQTSVRISGTEPLSVLSITNELRYGPMNDGQITEPAEEYGPGCTYTFETKSESKLVDGSKIGEVTQIEELNCPSGTKVTKDTLVRFNGTGMHYAFKQLSNDESIEKSFQVDCEWDRKTNSSRQRRDRNAY